jgi:hypothetical protein
MAAQIFVVGASRSGTTALARSLDLHSRVWASTELHFFEQLWKPVAEPPVLDRAEAVGLLTELLRRQRAFAQVTRASGEPFRVEAASLADGLGAGTAPRLFARFLEHEAVRAGRMVPCEHTPRNVYYVAELLRLLPASRVVVMVRDPRDVVASQKHKWRSAFLGQPYPRREALRLRAGSHVAITSLLWRAAVRAGDRHRGESRVMHVRFEELVRTPEPVLRDVCRFLGLDFEPQMLAVPLSNSSFEKASGGATGFDPRVIGRWRDGALTLAEIAICQRLTAAEMRSHGYEAVQTEAPALGIGGELATLPVHLAGSVALNARHYRQLRDAVRRRLARP